MQKTKWKCLSVLLLLSILAASCGSKNNAAVSKPHSDWLKKLLTQPACQPPCWENMLPGTTSMDEVAATLSNLNGIKIIHYSQEFSNPERQMDWTFDQSSDSGSAFGDDQGKILSYLYFGLSDSLTVEEVISSFGEPTNVLLYDCRTELSKKTCVAHIIYSNKGMALQTTILDQFGKSSYQVNISAQTQILGIWFLPTNNNSYENIIGKNSFNYPQYYYQWKGYSNYP